MLQSELNSKLFEDLVQYVFGAQNGFVLGLGRKAGSQVVKEVPTAALVTGETIMSHINTSIIHHYINTSIIHHSSVFNIIRDDNKGKTVWRHS